MPRQKFFYISGGTSIYHILLKTRNLDRAKTSGFNDHTLFHIFNIKQRVIVESRELSRGLKCEFSAECGIIPKIDENHFAAALLDLRLTNKILEHSFEVPVNEGF